MQRFSPLRLMHAMFWALGASLTYGLLAYVVTKQAEGRAASLRFVTAYVTSYHTVLSLGLILGTAWIVFRSQSIIPKTIETLFDEIDLWTTDYLLYKARFCDRVRSMTFSAVYMAVAFWMFGEASFPLTEVAEIFMMLAVCAEYAFGVYVGRKLAYAGMMLHSLLGAKVSRNLFRDRELNEINSYVHIASTLTVIFVYLHVRGYYGGTFDFDGAFGRNVRAFMILPAIIATPVLVIFNYYSRSVLRKLYSQSIALELGELRQALQKEGLTHYEKESYLLEVDRLSREELRYGLQLTLNDLPLGIALLVMLLQPLLTK